MDIAQSPTTSSSPEYVSGHSQKQRRSGRILIVFLVVMLLGGVGTLAYFYYTTNEKLRTQSQKLSDSYALMERQQEAGNFIAKYNDARLSRNLCSGNPLMMSDVHVNDKFITFRYLCANQTQPILIGAFAKHVNGETDFTYSSTPRNPNGLPDYIFDSEPAFFGGPYGTVRS